MVFTKWFIIILAALIFILLIYSWGYSDGCEDTLTDIDRFIDERGDNDDR